MDVAELIGLLSILLMIWVPILQTVPGLLVQRRDMLISETSLARSFINAKTMERRVFGDKLLSIRALVVSSAFTLVFAVLSLAIAYGFSGPNFRQSVEQDFIANWQTYVGSACLALLISVIIDFVSVVQTRWFVRRVTVDAKAWSLLGLLIFDAILSLLIFLVSYPILIVAVQAYLVDPMVLAGEDARSVIGIFWSSYVANLVVSWEQFVDQLTKFPTFYQATQIRFGWGSEAQLLYPYTTFLTSNFATSIWLWFCIAITVVVRLIILEKRVADALASGRITGRMLFYFGVALTLGLILLISAL